MSKRHVTVSFLVVALVLSLSAAIWATDIEAPKAKIIPKIDTVFGEERIDNYYWLRERDNPDVMAYLEAENAYTDEVMKHTEAFQEKLYQEIKSRIKETDLSVPFERGGYYYYTRNEEGKQYPIYCRKKGSLEAPEEIILDINQLAEGKEFMDVGAYDISPDQTLLAYGTDETGAERYDLRIKNLTTGELYPEVLEGISSNVTWAADNKTLFYTVYDQAWRPYQLYRHTLGTDRSEDVLIYQEDDELYWIGTYLTKDNAFLILAVGSNTTDEVYYLDATNPTGEFKVVHPREKGLEYSLTHHGDKFYITTNDNAVNFKLVSAPVSDPRKENWTEVIPARDEVKIDGLDMFKNYMVVYERERGLQTIRVTDMTTDETYYIDFPEPVYSYGTHLNPEFNTNILRFTYMSLVTPNSVYDYNMKTRERELKKQREVLGGYNKDDYTSERVFATAPDGAQVPISMVYRKGLVKDGNNPVYLYGYGSYGSSMDPWFSTARISLMDRGFIYAVAHIRGGGEMGRPWYEDGKLLKKKNTFIDFIACAEYLIKEKYTKPEKIAIVGGSAGGMLIGACVNMRPDLFGVAIAQVPFVDVMNTMLDPSLPLTVIEYEEWGNPNIEEYYRYMDSYSPYDNVKPMAYPNLLIMSSLNDTRVQYWEGAKWAAKLRANNTGHDRLLLKTNMGAGHGGNSGRYDALKEVAFEYAFILDCMGITE